MFEVSERKALILTKFIKLIPANSMLMPRIVAVVFACCCMQFLHAQTSDSLEMDVTEDYDKPNTDRDRFIFNLHWDGWLNDVDSPAVNAGAFSRGVGLHFFYDIPFSKNWETDSTIFSFAPGIGYSCSNYSNKVQFVADSTNLVSVVPFDESIDPKRNKLVLNYIEIPLEFRLRLVGNNGKSFKIAAGFKGSYMFSSHITYVGPESTSNLEEEVKYKTYRIKSLNTIQYGPTFRVGYGNINLQAYYGLNSIFEEALGPSGNPLVIGVSFNPF